MAELGPAVRERSEIVQEPTTLKTPEYNSQPSRPFVLPQAPGEFRKAVGLQEERPFPYENAFTEQETRIRNFVKEKQAKTPEWQFANDSSATLSYEDSSIEAQLSDQGLKAKLWRAYIGKRLGMFGLKRGTEILHTIESSVPIYNRKDINPKVVAVLIKSLDPNDEQAALDKFNLAIQRARRFYFLPRGYDFKNNQNDLIDAIGTLANTPEGVFSKIEQQFEGRTQALYHPGSIAGIYTFKTSLLPVIKQGGLTEKQLEMLDKAVVYSYFSGTLPFKTKEHPSNDDRNYEPWLSFYDLQDPEIPERLDKFYPYLIDWADGRLPEILAREAGSPPRYDSWNQESGRDLIESLSYLESTGQLSKLEYLLKNGWDCTGIYRKARGDPKDLDKALDETVSLQSDPVRMAWVRAMSEYYFSGGRPFTGAIDYHKRMLESKDSLIQVALIVNAFPKMEGFKPSELLNSEGDGLIGLDRYKFKDYLGMLLGRENLTETDSVLVNGIQNLLNTENRGVYNLPKAFSSEDLTLYSYLIANKDRIAGQVNSSYGHFDFDANLINELHINNIPVKREFLRNQINACQDQELLIPDLRIKYFDVLNFENKVKVLNHLPADYLDKQNQKFQLMVASFRSLTPSLQRKLVGGELETISKCFANGKPTLYLMELSLNAGFFEEVKPLIAKEVIDTLPEAKKEFFRGVWALPPEAALFLSRRTDQWSDYFISGKPTSSFLRLVAGGFRNEIDPFLTTADLSHLSVQEQEFWNYFKSIPKSPSIRKYLLGSPDRFSHWVAEGKPTAVFLEDMADMADPDAVRDILSFIDTANLPPEQKAFWEFYPQIDDNVIPLMRTMMLKNRDHFTEFIENGKPTLAFLNFASSNDNMAASDRLGLRREILALIDWEKLPPAERVFWEYYSNNRYFLESFLMKNKSDFPQMVKDGQETPLFYQKLLQEQPQTMLEIYKYKQRLSAGQYQNLWRMTLGKEAVDKFLATLPKATDEARNAFTGNDYDHTSAFLKFLIDQDTPLKQFGLNAETLPAVTAYIEKFGLSKNRTLYKYFHYLYLFEHKRIDELPSEMSDLGIDSTEQMIQKLAEVKRVVFGKELRDPVQLQNFSAFQIEMLANITRYDSARFNGGSSGELSYKVRGFMEGLQADEIPALPLGYDVETIESSSVKIEFNAEAVKGNYTVLQQEILEAIDKPPSADSLKAEVKDIANRRINQIGQLIANITNEKALVGMRRDLNNYQSLLEKVEVVSDLDSLALALLGTSFSKEDRAGSKDFKGVDSLMRRIILTKLYQRHHESPGFLENVRARLSKDEVTAEGIDEIVLTIDEMVKNHVLNLDQKNKEKYWKPEVFAAVLSNENISKAFRRITENFNPHAEKLRAEQARFIKTQTGVVSEVKIIPDRGFVGEMAGYLADVCYTRVRDLLRTYSGATPEQPMVVPYKFVIDDPNSGDPRFVGSVLVFEVQTAKGEPALVVRALDIPDEAEVDISKFTENLLDKFAEVAKRRGKRQVLVAGTGGTISNYSSITNHVLNTYVRGKAAEPVSPRFDFNGYDITNYVYTAREIN